MALVLWFKGAHSEPIYTIDARSSQQQTTTTRQQNPSQLRVAAGGHAHNDSMAGARHHVADAYRGRATFVSSSTPPYLDLNQLEANDQSEYRCRIDYRTRPRENLLAILFVLGEYQ